MSYESSVIKEIKPIASKEHINKHHSITALKIFFVLFFSVFVGTFLGFIIGVLSMITGMHIFIGEFAGFLIVATLLWMLFDYLLFNFLYSVTFKIYEDKVSFCSTFPVFYQAEVDVDDIIAVSTFQLPYEKDGDTGSLMLARKHASPVRLFLIPELTETKNLIKSLMKEASTNA